MTLCCSVPFLSGTFTILRRDRHLAGLALAHADAAVAVADDRQRREAEHAPAFHDLRHAVHRDHLFAQPVGTLFAGLHLARLNLRHGVVAFLVIR
jgi:hypothetical protein